MLPNPTNQSMMTLLILFLYVWPNLTEPAFSGMSCVFKNERLNLSYRMQKERRPYRPSSGLTNARLDTLSNWFSASRNYVEIIRQDDPLKPHYGIALAFEFDAENAAYPYTPAFAKLQFKDFSWGGLEFSARDSFNFTGVLNDVSEDLSIQVDSFRNDTITGRFSGLLLSGAGPMAAIDSGRFRVAVYRVE